METMEMYKKASGYKDVGYQYGEFCSKCGQNECEDGSRSLAARKRKPKFYERHCPSCHCPPERRRFYSPGRPRTSENIEVMLNQYERIPVEPVSSNIKKSQSSPLSQKVVWHECQTNAHCRCLRKSLHTRRQRRPPERDKYPLRMKRDTTNTEPNNEDLEVCPKYVTQPVPVKTTYSSLKKHNYYREPEESPDEQEFSDAESEASAKYIPHARQPRRSSRAPNTRTKQRHLVAGDGEYVAETKNENNDEEQDAREGYQEMRKLVLELEELERLKRGDGEPATNEGDNRLDGRRLETKVRRRNSGDAASYFVTSKPSYTLIKESINKTTKDLTLNGSAHFTKLNKLDNAARNRVLESIDHMVGIMDDAKTDAPIQREQQTEQETIEKIAHDLQENGWQLLFNALTIHRDATDSSRRTVRLECLNQIRQQLDKLYALESTLDNCPPKQQSPQPSRDMFNEDHQQSQQPEQKIADS